MKKRILSIFITVLMLLLQTVSFASELNDNLTIIPPEDKITDELKEVMSNIAEDEFISIIIWLNNYGDDAVYAVLSNKYHTTLNAYNEAFYIQSRVQLRANEYIDKISNVEHGTELDNKLLLEQTIINAEENKLNLSNMIIKYEEQSVEISTNILDEIEVSEKDRFANDWRESRKSINNSINNNFISKINTDKVRNVQDNKLLACVSLECEKSYVYEIAVLNEVQEIGYANQQLQKLGSNDEGETSELVVNEHHMETMDALGYDGTDVKIGVLEFEDEENAPNKVLLDPDNVHIKNKFQTERLTVNYSFCGVEEESRLISDHATLVVSIICGDNVNGYSGVAPNSHVYYAPFDDFPVSTGISEGGLFNALDWLINDCDVSVINMSCGVRYTVNGMLDYYSFLDQYFDCLISQYRVTIVKSSGNNYARISSPGLAMNAITVGNVTKDQTTSGLYEMHWSSSDDSDQLSNKPDVVAFGTQVFMHGNTDTSFISNTGTSFAAPQVTGIVALMMQANPDLIDKPDTIKSILVTNASRNVYSTSLYPIGTLNYGTTATCNTRDESGAGLVKAIESIKDALRNDYQRFYFSSVATEFETNRYYFYKDHPVEFAMIYEKGNHSKEDEPYEIDINIQILNSNNQVMFDTLHAAHNENCTSCLSGIDNVENFTVTLPENGYYTFRIYVMRGEFNDVSEETIPTIHNSAHNGIYASLNVSCGCNEKNIQSTFSETYIYEHRCLNCDTEFCENYSYDVETTNISYNGNDCGYVQYSIKFRMNPATSIEIDNSFVCKFVKDQDSLYDIAIVLDGGQFEYTSTGYKQTRDYMFVVLDEGTGAYVSVVYDSITIVYDIRIEYGAYLIN